MRKPAWSDLLAEAQEEVRHLLGALPPALRDSARKVPVVYERRPNPSLVADGLDPDLLGLFVGDPLAESGAGSMLPPQILLFLENLWDFAEGDWDIFLDEVETTYLHELGHYLGLDEIDLEERELD